MKTNDILVVFKYLKGSDVMHLTIFILCQHYIGAAEEDLNQRSMYCEKVENSDSEC